MFARNCMNVQIFNHIVAKGLIDMIDIIFKIYIKHRVLLLMNRNNEKKQHFNISKKKADPGTLKYIQVVLYSIAMQNICETQ